MSISILAVAAVLQVSVPAPPKAPSPPMAPSAPHAPAAPHAPSSRNAPKPPAPPPPLNAPNPLSPPSPPPATIQWVIGVNSNTSPRDSVWFNWSYEDGSGDRARTGSAYAFPQVPGLTPGQVQSSGASVQFRIANDAGLLDCAGKVGREKGRGDCEYVPDSTFADDLAKYGVRRPTHEEQTEMMLHGVRLADVAELHRLGYKKIDFRTLIAMRVYNLTPTDVVRGSIWLPK
jgi:hypothetical protein